MPKSFSKIFLLKIVFGKNKKLNLIKGTFLLVLKNCLFLNFSMTVLI